MMMNSPQNGKEKGYIKPGQVLNPGGRPKVPEALKAKCKAMSDEVVDFWIEMVRDRGSKGADRLRASENIMDRGWGKAIQTIEADISATTRTIDTSGMTEQEKQALAAIAVQTMGLDQDM
jgi:hypothetical protein